MFNPGVNCEKNQELLLKYLKEKKLEKFKTLLEHKAQNKINPDHVYGGTWNKTCLAEASAAGLTDYMTTLLRYGADPNVKCLLLDGKTAIHFAAQVGHIDAIKCLAEYPLTDVNAIDKDSNTALHLLASNLAVESKNAEDCFKYLAGLKEADIRHKNADGQSAISMAIGKCSESTWEVVLKRDYIRPEDRQKILHQHPELEKCNHGKIDLIYTHDDAYTDLRNERFEEFKNNFKPEFVNMTEMIESTFLQLACKMGDRKIVQFLLDYEADVNQTGTHEERPPVYLACYYGHYDILECLFQTDKVIVKLMKGKSLLHGVFQGLIEKRKPTVDYRKCLDYLLKKENPQIPINHRDNYGHTALHYAVEEEDSQYTEALLNHGAYIGHLNKFGFSPLHDISPQTLEEILDNCVELKKVKENQDELKFNLNMLNPTETCVKTKDAESGNGLQEVLPEMWPLYFISQSKKFGHLLKHPVLLMFLHLKWTRICVLFYINMIYYITFVILLTVVILSQTYATGECNGNPEPSVVWIILIVLTLILIVRELMQFYILQKKWRYFCNLDNILEVFIIATTIPILTGNCSKLLAAVTLLLAWMEVILLIGSIHKLAVYNEILKRVTLSYVMFLLWFLPLILAFSFSFYKLNNKVENPFQRKGGTFHVGNESGNFSIQDDNDNDSVDFYGYIHLSLLKTVFMMIGEFDASSMSFENGSYFVILFFVFMMTIVLMNLLNGLAVSDTQATKNDAELVTHKSRVKLVHHFESVVFGGPLLNCCSCKPTGGCPSLCRQWLQKAISLFPYTLSDGYLTVVYNHGIRYIKSETEKSDSDKEFRPDTCFRVGKCRLGLYVDREVLIAAKDVAIRRKKQSQHENNQIADRITKVEEDLQGCMKQIANLEGLLKQLINNSGQK